VIDENALARMLEAGELGGAGLDVFEHEPAVNPRLVKLAAKGKVVILPHMGSATIEGRIDMGEKVIINIRTFFDGHRPPDRVLPNRV
jgi:glyoxylate reductase